MGIASTRQEDGKERGGEVRVSAKKRDRPDLGVHVMQVRTVWCGPYGMVGMGWQLRWSTQASGYMVPRRAPMPAHKSQVPSTLRTKVRPLGRCSRTRPFIALDWEGSTRCEPSDRRHLKVR